MKYPIIWNKKEKPVRCTLFFSRGDYLTVREQIQSLELLYLAPYATMSANSAGRLRPEKPCPSRTCFQRDIDRIIHSKAFRRLKHKTQVFLQPQGDHYRTRLTHTIEVVRISRVIARALRLNEDLTEAVAWAHDLGHTPFGHAGERALNSFSPSGFAHNEQSLRVVDSLESNGNGLNLSLEVRDGILHHTGHVLPATKEAAVVRLSDRIAYINHDIDDAVRAGIIRDSDIPDELVTAIGPDHSARLNAFISDIISASSESGDISASPHMYFISESLRDFLFDRVYLNPAAKSEESKVGGFLFSLYSYFIKNPDTLPHDYRALLDNYSVERIVCDYIAGMTDNYAIDLYNNLFIPKSWQLFS